MSHAWLILLPPVGESSQLLRAHAGHLDNWSILRSTGTYRLTLTMRLTAHYIQILGTSAGYLWGNIWEILLIAYKNLQFQILLFTKLILHRFCRLLLYFPEIELYTLVWHISQSWAYPSNQLSLHSIISTIISIPSLIYNPCH